MLPESTRRGRGGLQSQLLRLACRPAEGASRARAAASLRERADGGVPSDTLLPVLWTDPGEPKEIL